MSERGEEKEGSKDESRASLRQPRKGEKVSSQTQRKKERARKTHISCGDIELRKQIRRTLDEYRRRERGRRGWDRAVREADAESWYLNREEVTARKPGAVREGQGWMVPGKAGDSQVCSVTLPGH